MYIPKHFEERRVEILHELIITYPMATLVTLTERGLDANHIPFELDTDPVPFGTLRGHIARANSLWRDYSKETEVMAIFQGVNTYISPSWYASKPETGKVVPTWNYAVVHAHGPLRIIEDKHWLRQLVERLTNHHEANRNQPWRVTDAPEDYIDKQLGAIIGLEIPIARLIGKFKVSQNRSAQDQQGVIEGLQQEGNEVAIAMSKLVRESKSE